MTDSTSQAVPDRHSFIVRVWREGSADQAGGQWRGSIEHVPSGERVHFMSLAAVTEFINQYWNQSQNLSQGVIK